MAPMIEQSNNMDSLEAAVEYFIDTVTKGRGILADYVENSLGRYCAVIDYPELNIFGFAVNKRYYVLYKRNWENRFGRIFEKSEQRGQNITPEALEMAMFDDATIACVMIDNSVWVCNATEWFHYVRINKTVRDVQWKDHKPYKEASIPKSMMKKIL